MSDKAECRDCGHAIAQGEAKALSGEVAVVWADFDGEWVCPVTGDEHEPGTPLRPVIVTVKHGNRSTMIRLSLAEYGNFMVSPMLDALDDGDASWDLQERNPERHASLAHWAKGLYKVTAP